MKEANVDKARAHIECMSAVGDSCEDIIEVSSLMVLMCAHTILALAPEVCGGHIEGGIGHMLERILCHHAEIKELIANGDAELSFSANTNGGLH